VSLERVLDRICDHWPATMPPKPKHLHIIVEPPSDHTVPVTTPPDVTLGIKVIDEIINEELDSLRGIVETFLKDPEPRTWIPPDYVTSSDRDFLTNLRIPSYRNGNPSLLFHNLDVCDDEEIKMIFGPGAHECICNTSGSGKTRRMLEGLTKYWGFYLVAIPNTNGVGVRDLEEALNQVAQDSEWVSDLENIDVRERAAQGVVNSQIASKHLRKVLAARIVVFRLFLQLAIQVDGTLQEKHKRIITEAVIIVQSHMLKGQSPTYRPVTARLVEYELASLREGSTICPLCPL